MRLVVVFYLFGHPNNEFGHPNNEGDTSTCRLLKDEGKQNGEIFVVYRKYATGSRILPFI